MGGGLFSDSRVICASVRKISIIICRREVKRAGWPAVQVKVKEIFRYKGKHILYNTGEVQQTEEKEETSSAEELGALTEEQMNVVKGSMSDNRISDSVKDLVEKASAEPELSEEQMNVVKGSMSDNRISDSVRDLVEKASQ